MKNLVIVTTASGKAYATRISRSWKYIADNIIHTSTKCIIMDVNEFSMSKLPAEFTSSNTIILARAAYPSLTSWMKKLKEAEEAGYTVVNSVNTLLLTSNKLECALKLYNSGISHPKTWMVKQGENPDVPTGEYVIKPITSKEQGARVKHLVYGEFLTGKKYWSYINNTEEDVALNSSLSYYSKDLGDEFVLQEYIPYTAIHRVIVIGGQALPYTFVDKPEWHTDGNWKVSVCLNKTSMQFNGSPDPNLLKLAVDSQKIVGGQINFIDIFETKSGFTISEINTACNLSIHEGLAKGAGRSDWNIHYRIARYLSKI